MHKYGIIEGSNFISIKDADAPNKEDYTDGASIGPYSSSDGFTYDIADKDFEDKTNTLSLVTEFELDANEAVSIVFPVSAAQELIDFSEYNGLNVALKRESLTGDLRLYIDAGKVTERFDPLDSTIQKEILDDGLKYLITDSGSFYLYKGKNDGINSTNDLDGNGLLDTDSSSDITRLIDSDTSSDYITITEKYNNLSFLIKEPEKLKTMRGVRITLYSPTGASGRLIFNQLRFIESGWQYDNIGGSDAAEISPIEDSFLLDHIFSEENPEIDTKLHYQRFKERTLRINLKQGDSFYIQKRFGYPIDIANYKKLSFFIMLKEKTRRRLKLTLTDTSGNTMNDIIALDDLSKHKWHKLTFLFDSFDGYNRSNKLISDIKIDFENEGLDTDDNTIYIDEIYLDEANVSFGFATKNEFIYSEPQLDIKKNDFSIFQSPYIKWLTSFNTANFLIEELTPYRDYKFNNKLTISFRLTELDYHFYSSLDFIFRDNLIYNPAESLIIKISKVSKKKNPFIFTIFYDYSKFGISDITKASVENLSQSRNLLLELGAKFEDRFSFKFGYDVDTSKRTISYTMSKFFTEYTININDIYNKFSYSIQNKREVGALYGSFSLDNLGFLFRDDFISFFNTGKQKKQDFEFHYGFYLFKPVYFSNDIIVNHSGDFFETTSIYEFKTKFSNNIQFDIKIKYLQKENSFFVGQYMRKIETNHKRDYENIIWTEYFKEFGFSINYIIPIILYPPFSSIYKREEKYLIGDSIEFNVLSDSLKLNWNWSIFLKSYFFLPYAFSFCFTESIVNTIVYTPSYIFTFIVVGGGERTTNIFKVLEMKYTISEIIGVKKGENSYKTQFAFSINFYTYKDLDIESTISYDINYVDAANKKELNHKIKLASMLYKNFFRKNYITNDKYGVEMSFLTEISSSFHNRLDDLPVSKIDNPFDFDFTPKVGYRFNKNLTLSGIIKLGYSFDYSQKTLEFVHRYGVEFSVEGVLSF